MKKVASSLMSVSLLCLASGVALADHHKDQELKEHITLYNKVWINNAEVKPGKYLVRYDQTTGEMKLYKGNDVVAHAKATVKMNDEKFEHDALLLDTSTGANNLKGIRLGGQRAELQLDTMTAEEAPITSTNGALLDEGSLNDYEYNNYSNDFVNGDFNRNLD